MDPVLLAPAPKCNGRRPEIRTLHTVTAVVEEGYFTIVVFLLQLNTSSTTDQVCPDFSG